MTTVVVMRFIGVFGEVVTRRLCARGNYGARLTGNWGLICRWGATVVERVQALGERGCWLSGSCSIEEMVDERGNDGVTEAAWRSEWGKKEASE